MEERDLRGLFEALTPTEEHKEKLLSRMTVMSRDNRRRAGRPFKPVFLAMAVIVCLFATSAYSAAYLGLDAKWLKYLGLSSSEQERYLANGAYVVDKTVTNKDGTLIVKQIMGDSNLLYIMMDFIAPEGTVLDKARYRFHGFLDTEGLDSYGSGFDLLEDDNPKDNKISLVMSLSTNRIEAGQEAVLTIENLEEADPYPDEFEKVITGEWQTTFNLDYKDYSKRYEVDKPIGMYGRKATIEALSVSPISITLFLRSGEVSEIFESTRLHNSNIGSDGRSSDDFPVTIHYKNGTSVTTTVSSGMAQGHPTLGDIMIVKPFLPIIDPQQIESFEFFGAVVPVGD